MASDTTTIPGTFAWCTEWARYYAVIHQRRVRVVKRNGRWHIIWADYEEVPSGRED